MVGKRHFYLHHLAITQYLYRKAIFIVSNLHHPGSLKNDENPPQHHPA